MKTLPAQPPLWIITFNGEPITLERIWKVSGSTTDWFDYEWEGRQYIAGGSRKAVVERFLHYVGFTWGERIKGFDIQRLLS